MTRLLVVARNSKFPALNHSAPASPPRVPSSPRGTLARSQSGNAAPYSAAPASVVSAMSPLRAGAAVAPCATGFRVQGAPLFDATAGRWIIPPPGKTPVAGAAADLRSTQAAHTLSFQPRPRPLADPPRASGHLRHAIVETLTVALGLTVFGLIAGVFLILA